ncbi:hypothetical protein [Humidesulfovibrio idahonensis]
MEVGWHLRFTREDALVFLVQPKLAPNVEDAVFVAGGWLLEWNRDHEACADRGVGASAAVHDVDERRAPERSGGFAVPGEAGVPEASCAAGGCGEPGESGIGPAGGPGGWLQATVRRKAKEG